MLATSPCKIHKLLIAVVLVLFAVSGNCFSVKYTPVGKGRAAGDVLVLDVASLWPKRPTQPVITIPTPTACQRRCDALPGCNAYAFCDSKAGCGQGCKAYAVKQQGSAVPPTQSSTPARRDRNQQVSARQDTPSLKLPIKGFGPFVSNSSGAGCNQTNTDKWAFGTCTLLSTKLERKATAAPAAEGVGWVSAWQLQPLPKPCEGLSARACAACHTTSAASACLTCMKDTRIAAGLPAISLIAEGLHPNSTGAPALDQCVTCALLPAKQQQQCVSCVATHGPCNTCVTYPGAPTELKLSAMGPCMDCVTSKGKRFAPTCITCAATRDVQKCMSCLPSFYPSKICKTNQYVDCYKPEFDNPCATCLTGQSAAYDSCISCYSTPAARQDCDSCNQLDTADKQRECYKCSKTTVGMSSDMPGGCGLCFAQSLSPAVLKQCLACVTSKSIAVKNHQYCSQCASGDLTDSQVARCFKCLDSSKSGSSCSMCSSSTTSDAAMASCLACFGNANNSPDCQDCSTLESANGSSALDSVRKQCFDCVVSSKLVAPVNAGFVPLGSCATCFSPGVKDVSACVSCNTNLKTSITAKTWCASCVFTADAKRRAACISCLQANALQTSDAYMRQCKVQL